jgi:hypothetical protein
MQSKSANCFIALGPECQRYTIQLKPCLHWQSVSVIMPVTATCGSHTELALATLGSAIQIGSFLLAKASKEAGSAITKKGEDLEVVWAEFSTLS